MTLLIRIWELLALSLSHLNSSFFQMFGVDPPHQGGDVADGGAPGRDGPADAPANGDLRRVLPANEEAKLQVYTHQVIRVS